MLDNQQKDETEAHRKKANRSPTDREAEQKPDEEQCKSDDVHIFAIMNETMDGTLFAEAYSCKPSAWHSSWMTIWHVVEPQNLSASHLSGDILGSAGAARRIFGSLKVPNPIEAI